MKVCHIHGYYDPQWAMKKRGGRALLDSYPLTRHLPIELARLGHEVNVLHHFHQKEAVSEENVRFEFLPPPRIYAFLGRVAARFFNAYGFPYFQLATPLLRRLIQIDPQIIHYFGLNMTLNLWLICRWAVKRSIPVVVHYHGGAPARRLWPGKMEQANLARISRVMFTTLEYSNAWIQAGLAAKKVRLVMETSSDFNRRDKIKSRQQVDIQGDPVIVSVARLHPTKDLLIVLRGFVRISQEWENASLYLYYRSAEQLAALKREVRRHPPLAQKVHFRGEVSHPQMAEIMNEADFLLQASLEELSGCAVLEAMALGVIPVVTNIPSFRMMTENGRFGRLFPPGDAESLAQQVLELGKNDRRRLAREIREKFARDLSFNALARRVNAIYAECQGGAVCPDVPAERDRERKSQPQVQL